MTELQTIYDQTLAAASALGKTEADMVFGEGDRNATLMLVGEAPGAEETRQKRPFVGKAGRNLDEFLGVLGLQRADIYITNVVKFRPTRISDRGRLSNRPPSRDEIALMLPHLLREIGAVSPRVVVSLGNVPLKALLHPGAAIGSHHARPAPVSASGHAYTLFPLYHPASIIYNRALAPVYAQDLAALKQYLQADK